MNYSDFDKIEQDEWSLTRPTFPTPKGGTLTVVGWSGRNGSQKKYVVECNLCRGDKELHGDGVYKITKGGLVRGQVPCGCAKCHKFSKHQWEVRIRRVAEEKGLKFISFIGEFKGARTKLALLCPNHGFWDSTTVSSFVLQGCGCPTCKISLLSEANTKDTEGYIAEFMATGKFHRATKFWRSERKTSRGFCGYWFYECPVCNVDEYAKAGLCNGIFEILGCQLKKGHLACRCSKQYKYTEEQWTFRMEKETKNNDHVLVKWLSKPGRFKKFQYLCPHHGEQVATANNYLSGRGCPICAGKNQQQCYINQVFDGDLIVSLKFGIAKDSSRRTRDQNSSNLFKMGQIGIWEFPSVKSCKAAEKQCKKELECGVLSKRDLEDGHTETTHIKNLDRIIEIYENHGGKRINTNEER